MPRASSSAITVSARWLFPVTSQPLQNGQITVKNTRIENIAAARERRSDLHLDDCAIVPGFVNAHTHLDLSGMKNLAPPTADFVSWLRSVIQHRRQISASQVEVDIRRGLDASVRAGTTLVGDIASQGLSWPTLTSAPIRSVVLYEILGLSKERAEQAAELARNWLKDHPATQTCRPGLSPHAPYSVRRDLFTQAALMARASKAPLAVHVAESQAELDLLHHQRGPFVDFLKDLGVWDPDGLADSPDQVMKLCDQRIPKLFIHCNYLAPSTRIARTSTIVYCPRTHAAFGHPPHPFREFLSRGVRVALGTDSLASNPDLDMLGEARFVRERYGDFPDDQLLRMLTLSGAEALGFGKETGSLEAGKSADLVVLRLPKHGAADPHELLFDPETRVEGVMCQGKWVHGEETTTPLS
jgi:cytosine/adenosine deaminase-related metal-dependent hydrolase